MASLAAAGISTYRLDYRGHGRADGRRGHVNRFEEYLGDVRAFRDRVFEATDGLPRFLLGHSNGGLIALHFASRFPEGLDGVVLSSPFFGFGLEVPAIKAAAGKLLSRVLPTLALPTDLDPATVSHDDAVVRAYAEDPLGFKTATARWFTESVQAHADSPARAAALSLPILVQQAGDDRIASADAAHRVYEAIGSADKTWKLYEDLFHEIWFEAEPGRSRTHGDLVAWLEGQLRG